MKKSPYVLHVDGTAKGRGIHKHLWCAAVRGQCGRLDPTIGNIHNHQKQVVDSIWNALQKEWEFEGFAHRAREMFERASTKCMRNRKMHLKKKCQKSVTRSKPDDVSGGHWSRIVDITEKNTNHIACNSLTVSTGKGKEIVSSPMKVNDGSALVRKAKGKQVIATDEKENDELEMANLEIEDNYERCSPKSPPTRTDSLLLEREDVDSRIRILQTELLRLQRARKSGFSVEDGGCSSECRSIGKDDFVNEFVGDLDVMQENIVPPNKISDEQEPTKSGKKRRARDAEVGVKVLREVPENKSAKEVQEQRDFHEEKSREELKEVEMDYGEVVRVHAFTGGRKEEIGKGIVMGLAGTKYARKVIPKGWRSIKLVSYTSTGASKICPFPAGWSEQSKNQTVKEANGRTIVWPDMLLTSLLQL